jgi:hypothetical protein
VIAGALAGDEVVVGVEAGFLVPQVLVDGGATGDGAEGPGGGFLLPAEGSGEVCHVPFVLVEQAIEADGSEFNG